MLIIWTNLENLRDPRRATDFRFHLLAQLQQFQLSMTMCAVHQLQQL
jgi:hypothetical protein